MDTLMSIQKLICKYFEDSQAKILTFSSNHLRFTLILFAFFEYFDLKYLRTDAFRSLDK